MALIAFQEIEKIRLYYTLCPREHARKTVDAFSCLPGWQRPLCWIVSPSGNELSDEIYVMLCYNSLLKELMLWTTAKGPADFEDAE
jgi:hypothetical protein